MFNLILILQPLLISSYAVLFTYLSAIGEVSFFEFLTTYLFVLSISYALIICFKLIYKSFSKSFYFTSIFLLFFWNVTPVSRSFYNFNLFGIQIFRLRYLIPITFVFLFILFVRLFKSKKQEYFLSSFFFYPYLVLNLFCVFNIVKEKIVINDLIEDYKQDCVVKLKRQHVAPDIYFILLDTYLSQEVLKQSFNFENKEFLKSLQAKGFQILNNSYSNYPETVSSLSATLNMNYHENVKSGDQQQFFGLGFYKNRNNFVSKFLKFHGYKIINIPSAWGDMPKNNYANVDYYSVWPKRFFANLLERMSIISPFVYLYIGYNSRNVFFEQLKTIESHIKDACPKFIFAHILMPHSPFVFDENGNKTNSADWLNDSKMYLGQLKFVNKKIDELINKILQQSEKPPIIILQADHGLNAGIMFSDYSKINEIKKNKLVKSFGILNAVYCPEAKPFEIPVFVPLRNGTSSGSSGRTGEEKKICLPIVWNELVGELKDIVDMEDDFTPAVLPEERSVSKGYSPINTFRFIFNNYFGTNFKILKDETFVGPSKNGRFVKVKKLREKE